jgi:sigma-B regulation protein RsbU (phosphoserine phosphatase)
MLRHRILLIFTLGIGLLALALAWTAAERDRLTREQIGDIATRGQRAVWQQRAGDEARTLSALADQISSSQPLLAALSGGDRDAITHAIAVSLPDVVTGTSIFEIVDAAGRPIHSGAERVEGARTLDLRTLAEVIGGQPITGLRQDGPDRFLILHAFPLSLPDGRSLAVTIGTDAEAVLRDFSLSLDAAAFLINPRNRVVTSTTPGLWEQVAPTIPLRRASFSLIQSGARRYTVTAVPVEDLGGGQAALAVTLRDATAPLEQIVRQRRIGIVGLGLGLVALLVGMHLYLRRAFRPLDKAIDVLAALGRGDTSVRMEARGQAEIGRIAAVVAHFRSYLVELAELRVQGNRRARRQERLIRARMKELAGSLDDTARAEIVTLLDQEAPAVSEGAPSDLALLANVLQLLSRRITEQHRRLTDMIEDLREAIVTRARLAGITQELEIARQLQASLLPASFPDIPGFTVDASMIPAREIGGDFYDFFEVAPGRFVLVVGDVSGKGVPAALFMAIVRTLVRAATRYEPDPARCIAIVNEVLAEQNEQMMFVTLFYAVLSVGDRRLTYVNAGHNPPLLVMPDGKARFLPATGDMAAAVLEDFVYHTHTRTMAPGETLLVYSDGLTEAFDPDGAGFGEDRLSSLAAALDDGRSLPDFSRGLLDGLSSFVRGAQQSDDITLLALRCQPPLSR